MSDSFETIRAFMDLVGETKDLRFPEYQEIELRDGHIIVHVEDPGLELPPECSTRVSELMGQAGLGHVGVEYIHSAGPIELLSCR